MSIVKDVLSGIGGVIISTIRHVMYFFVTFIYDLIVKLYNIFIFLCSTRLMNEELFKQISTRVGAILGLIMLFNVIFAFIKLLLDPDSILDKEKGAVSVFKKVFVVIVLLGTSSFIFNSLFFIQRSVISSNAISKIFLPAIPKLTDPNGNTYKNSKGQDRDVLSDFGGLLAEETFYAFYHVEEFDIDHMDKNDKEYNTNISMINYCRNVVNDLRSGIVTGNSSYSLGYICLNESIPVKYTFEDGTTKQGDEWVISFSPLSLLVGIAMVYFIFIYSIKIGYRMIQLMLLEIISPMAVVSYLSPKKDNMFSKWMNIYISTYIDVFIRVAIVNLSCLIISALFTTGTGLAGFSFYDTLDGNATKGFGRYYIVIIMILAILSFAKKAPELLKEILPTGGASKIGFGATMKMSDFLGLGTTMAVGSAVGTSAAVGLLGGGVAGFAGGLRRRGIFSAIGHGALGALGGLGGGVLRGVGSGFSSKNIRGAISNSVKHQHDANATYYQAVAEDSTFLGRTSSRVRGAFGIETSAKAENRRIEALQNYHKNQETMESYADGDDDARRLKREFEFIQQSGRRAGEDDAAFVARLNAARDRWKNRQRQVITDVIQGNTAGLDNLVVSNIQSVLDANNRLVRDNREAFDEAGVGLTTRGDAWDVVDLYSRSADSAANRMQNSRQHSRHEADDRAVSGNNNH